MSVMVLSWRQPARPLTLTWRGPIGGGLRLFWRQSPKPLALSWRGPEAASISAVKRALMGVIASTPSVTMLPAKIAEAMGAIAAIIGPSGDSALSWSALVTSWSTEPTKVASVTAPAAGDVWAYVQRGTTRYRFVPAAYDPELDAFYGAFSAGVLSDLIAARG